MKHRTLFFLFGASIILITFMAFNNGPYPENTNAPGEMTCYRSGCHANNGSGSGNTFILNVSSGGVYQNQDTLQLRFGFSNTFNNEHGFQILALDTGGNNVGNWMTNNSSQYKVISGFSFPNRQYLEHTLSGSADSVWQIDWVTPTTYQGKVKFYASFLASNDNNLNTGDTLYLNTLELVHNQLTEIAATKKTDDIQLDYIVKNGNLLLKKSISEPIEIKVFDLKGRRIHNLTMLNYEQNLFLNNGIYIVTVSDQNFHKMDVFKVFIP